VSLVTIDGSTGEGGGQILRTALSLAILLGRPLRVVNIRAGRKQPGLRPQHVQAVKAAAAICNASLEGAKEHSRELLFTPQTSPQPGTYHFSIGTAGAATLVLQTVLLPLSHAPAAARVTVNGGTHVSWSPPFDYLDSVYLPALARLGYRVHAELGKWGFYPKGGGEITLHIDPWAAAAPSIPTWAQPRGALQAVRIVSAAANVGNQVTARQAKQAFNRLVAAGFSPSLLYPRLLNPSSVGPGSCLFLLAEYADGVAAGFTGYGRQGYPAERVADEAVDAFIQHHQSGAAVDPYLADQLVLPLALAGQDLVFSTGEITQHLLTNTWVVAQFMGQRFEIAGQEGQQGAVRCMSSPF
jgi:RNA 3'-terminal phosphate cyclase (ATP)